MCTGLLPPGANPIAVKILIIIIMNRVTSRPERVKYRMNCTEDVCTEGLLHSPTAPHCPRQNCHDLTTYLLLVEPRNTGRTNNSLGFAVVPDLLHCNNLGFLLIFCVVCPEHVVSSPKQITNHNKTLLFH